MRTRAQISSGIEVGAPDAQLQIASAFLEVLLDCRDMLVAIRRELAVHKREKETSDAR